MELGNVVTQANEYLPQHSKWFATLQLVSRTRRNHQPNQSSIYMYIPFPPEYCEGPRAQQQLQVFILEQLAVRKHC